MKEIIMKVPSFSADYPKAPIYVADLVRCKECKYKNMELCPMYKLVVAGVRKYDDFCSYGEREDN